MTYLMNMDRLKTLLDAYGASPSRWPADERDAAEAMIASSEAARETFAETARLDALLDQAPPPPPVDRLGWRLRGIGPRAEQSLVVAPRRGAFALSNLARAAAVVLAVAGGVAIGTALPGHRSTVQTMADNTIGSNNNGLPLSTGFEEAGLDGNDSGITLAGYAEDGLNLPLQ